MHLSLPCTPDSECVLRTTLGCLSGLVTCFMHHILHAMLFSLSFFFWVFNSPAVQSQLHSIIISWHVSAILLPPFPLIYLAAHLYLLLLYLQLLLSSPLFSFCCHITRNGITLILISTHPNLCPSLCFSIEYNTRSLSYALIF